MSTTVIRRQPALPAKLLASVQAVLARLTPGTSSSLLPFIPKPIKILLLLLFLANSNSFPFVWHIRVWWYAIKAYYKVYRKGRTKYLDDWVKNNRWQGGIAGIKTRVHRIATLDDCDYNLHLSNSCYAKNSDPARMDWCIAAMSPLFTSRSHMALGASHYIFYKEIPLLSEYVIETRTGGWGDKWFYVVSEFIIYPKKSNKHANKNKVSSQLPSLGKAKEEVKTLENKLLSSVAITDGGVAPSTMSAGASTSSTPDIGTGSGAGTPSTSSTTTLEGVKYTASYRAREPRKDGGIVCGLGVFEYCFKMGRVTIPPRIGLYLALQSPTPEARAQAKKIVMSKDHGSSWLRGGWRNEPNAETLGNDIGLPSDMSGRVTRPAEGEDTWYEKGRKGMELVVEGLGVF